jgi:hypothetical protein
VPETRNLQRAPDGRVVRPATILLRRHDGNASQGRDGMRKLKRVLVFKATMASFFGV